MTKEKRRERRFQAPDMKSEISDGKSGFVVVVDDVSRSGVGVGKVPKGFDETVQKCLAVINASTKDFKLVLHPCWIQATPGESYKKIGFKIDDPSESWLQFVKGVIENSQIESERSDARLPTQGMMALISDGTKTYYGVVDDLSENGLRLSQIPPELDDTASNFSVVIQSPTGEVKVSMLQCWLRTTKKGMYKTIGFKVQNPPPGWQKLIAELEKEDSILSFFVLEDEEEPLKNTAITM